MTESTPTGDGFRAGDRVVIRNEPGTIWRDPRVQLRMKRGCPATVIDVYGTKIPTRDRSYRIEFDAVGRMKPLTETVPHAYLEPCP